MTESTPHYLPPLTELFRPDALPLGSVIAVAVEHPIWCQAMLSRPCDCGSRVVIVSHDPPAAADK